ncbi:MAG: ABC-F family ATP-binding cassette domain-containing protein [Armatimonadota bacterium]
MAAVYLQLQNVSKAFGEEEILADVSLQVREGECFGLIGPNGAGKSTLFRIVMGQEHADRGEVVVPRGVRVGYLTQDAELAPDGTVLAGLIASRTDLTEIAARMHELETAMAAPNAHEDAAVFDRWVREHASLAERFHHLGGDTLGNDAQRILRGLSLGPEYDDAVIGTLSGGEKRRLALAALLLAAPDLLLLDEPTNHLDLAAINWLEEFLRAYRGGVLIVSHDRFLLDRVADHIAEIEDTRLRQFDGNYSAYQQKKEAENAMLLKRAETIERERARLAEVIQRLFSFRLFTRMRSAQKQLYKLEQIQLPGEPAKSRMVFKPARNSGREVLTVRDVRKRYTDAPLLEGASFTIWRHDRAALIGPNGCGKTTLIRIIVGQLGLDAGTTEFGHGVDWYYYDQEGGNLDPRNTVLQEVWRGYPHLSQSEVRGALARFLIFGEDVERPVGTLSGGERSRVSLAKMFLSGANLLILDEPTNHLDIDGKEALEEALADYTGTVLMVSHDRYFMDRTANRVLEVEHGAIREYLGNYTEFLERKARLTAAATPIPAARQAPKPAAVAPPDPDRRRSLQFRQRQQQEIEERIGQMETRKTELEALLADPDLYVDGLRAKTVTDEHQHLLTDLHAVYEEWAAVSEEVLTLEAEADALRQERLAKH